MSTNGFRALLAAALAGLLVFSIAQHVHGKTSAEQGRADQGDSMSGMDMPKIANSPTPETGNAGVPDGYREIRVSPSVQQRIGVTLGRVERGPLTMSIRTVGIVQADETRVAHIHVKTEGWVEKLYVSFTGQKVKAGEPLLSIYSPAFFAAQREYLSALQATKSPFSDLADQQAVLETARRRLELWDIPKQEIESLEKSAQTRKALDLRSPISGTVLEKQAFTGQYVTSQSDLYVVADLSAVWIQARIFQYELPHVSIGTPAAITVPSAPARPLTGKVVFIDPVVDEMSRSVRVRIEIPNSNGQFRPGMFGDVSIVHAMGAGLTVPASAVIRTGERDIAFRAVATDRFVPVEVKISPLAFGDRFQVLEGLAEGDQVVTSANFLIDSESRLEAGSSSMADMPGMGGGQ